MDFALSALLWVTSYTQFPLMGSCSFFQVEVSLGVPSVAHLVPSSSQLLLHR